MQVPDEALAESAMMAGTLARALCTRTPASCAWYHAVYPLLRLLDLAPTPERHGAFYDEVLRTLAAGGAHARVAITGTADTCMLAHVLRAYRKRGVEPRVTVVDRCATPLRLCEAFARRAAADVRTVLADARHWQPEEPVDVVATHAFIGMLPHARQPELVASWRRALRSGGALVSVARVDPGWSVDLPGFSPEQVEAFSALVARRAAERGIHLASNGGPLVDQARAYARRMRSFPFASAAALRESFERAGFRVDRLDLCRFAGQAGAGESGPGTHRPGTFAHFVATAR